MASKVDIYNQALSLAGSTRLLEGPDEDCVEAQQCNLWWPQAIAELLRRGPEPHGFPFSRVRVVLADTGETRTDWGYVYAAPAGALKVRAIVAPGSRAQAALVGVRTSWPGATVDQAMPVPFRLEARVNALGVVIGQVVLTDQAAAECIYTAPVDDPNIFPPDFVNALAWRLTIPLAHGVAKDENRARYAGQMADYWYRVAAASAANEGAPDAPGISSFEAARR